MDHDFLGASLGEIIEAGILSAGLLVLRRPLHVSVLALLSVDGSSRRSWCLGACWGFGHSVAIVTTAATSYSSSSDWNLLPLDKYWNLSLAVLLLLLGLWGVRHYLSVRKLVRQRQVLEHLQRVEQHVLSLVWPLSTIPETTPCSHPPMLSPDFEVESDRSSSAVLYDSSFDDDLTLERPCCGTGSSCTINLKAQLVIAVIFGLLQGLAVYDSVLPALPFDNNGELAAFLVAFCVTSILLVSCSAALVGAVTGRLSRASDDAIYRVGLGCSCGCIGLALTWIAFTAVNASVGQQRPSS
ncbi:hypothetical protein ON010_g3313 [Phytophthora cinnamomi]|nr:hypothetical protein ON010_g3313 [Phytophthora cinnamomi]